MSEKKEVIVVIGALGAESDVAKRLLKAAGVRYTSATLGDNYVKNNKQAYMADGVKTEMKPGQSVCFFQCKVKGLAPLRVFEPLSENPDLDLGSPEFFWGSSAVGQLASALISDPHIGGARAAAEKIAPILWEARFAAASEHYLSDAYAGKCPGVDPTALRLWRAMNRAEFAKKTPRELMNDADKALKKITSAPRLQVGDGYTVASIEGFVPEIVEGAAMAGVPVMYSRFDKVKEKTKVTVINGKSGLLKAWLAWAKSDDSGLTGVYGDSSKGYAGGFIEK